MRRVVIDTRFLVECFYSRDPEKQRRLRKLLEELIAEKRGILPTIAIAEIVQETCRRRGVEEAKVRYYSLLRNGLEVAPIGPDVALQAGLLKCKHPNVPIGDCLIAAIAITRKAAVLSDDPHFDEIKGVKRTWIQ